MDLNLFKITFRIVSFVCFSSYINAQALIRSYAPDVGIDYNVALTKTIPSNPLSQINGKLNTNTKELKENYNIHLGNLNYPISTFSSNYKWIQYCSLSDFLENLTAKIKLTDSNIPVYKYFIGINIYQYAGSTDALVFYKYLFNEPIIMPIEENTTIPQYLADSIINNMDSLSLLKIDIIGSSYKNYIGGVLISPYGNENLSKENKEFVYYYSGKNKWVKEVPVSFSRTLRPSNSPSDEVYGFQVMELDGHQYLKVDSLEKGTKSFLSYYINKPEVKIIQLPGFKTKDRFINLNSTLYSPDTMEYIKLDSRSLNELVYLYDYTNSNNADIKLSIGDIISKSIDYYINYNWLLNNINIGLSIITPEGEFTPYHFELIIDDQVNKMKFISGDNINNPAILPIITRSPTPSKYYFQNILFVDKKGRKTRLNKSFAFTVLN